MKFPKSEKDFEELMKGIKWNRIIPPLVSVLQPVIIFGLWLGFSKIDKRADAVSKLIAIAEPIPTIDLNLPRPVVLASLYHSTAEALDSTVNGEALEDFVSRFKERFTGDWMDPGEIEKPKEGETWQQFLERRLRETGLFA